MSTKNLSIVCELFSSFSDRGEFKAKFNEVIDLISKDYPLLSVSKVDGDLDVYLFEFDMPSTEGDRAAKPVIDLVDLFMKKGMRVITYSNVYEYDSYKESMFVLDCVNY